MKKSMDVQISKRGQITIFIIIGIILLFTVALVVYLVNSSAKVHPPVQQLVVSDSVRPIQVYVTDCLSKVSKDALLKIGETGGYATLENKHLSISPIPYRSDALIFEPQILPYWYHLKDCKENSIGCLDSRMPPLCKSGSVCVIDSRGDNSIEQELDDYVSSHITDCVGDFGSFKDRFDITNTGKIGTETVISESNVEFKLNYPLTVSVKGSKGQEDIPYFYASHDVSLKNVYELAKDIFEAESNQHFLELTTMNLVNIYSGVDRGKLPPVSTLEFNGQSPQIWTRTNVKEQLQDDILPYLGFIRITGTNNGNTIVSTETDNYSIYAQGIYHSLAYKFSNKTYDLDADIIYPYSDIYLNIGGSEIIKGETLFIDQNFKFIMNLVGFSMTQYKFKYDMSYPVIVKITDPTAFNGEGYTFNYAMEANIRQNVPVTGNLSVINLGGINGVALDSELQKVNRTIHIETIDAHTKESLPDVIITYICGQSYDIGRTALSGAGANVQAVLDERFPYCQFGGEITFEKEGYMGTAIEYNNPEGTDDKTFSVELWPIQEKNIVVLKRTQQNVQSILAATSNIISTYKSETVNLTENDTVYLDLSRVKDDPLEQDMPLVGFLAITGSNQTAESMVGKDAQKKNVQALYDRGQIDAQTRDDLTSQIDMLNTSEANDLPIVSEYTYGLVPGTYTLDATLLHIPSISIPAKTLRYCKGVDTGVADICIGGWEETNLPAQELQNFPVGGGGNITFTLSENDIYNNDKTLTFYVLEMPLPQTWDDLQNYKTIDDYQADKAYLLNPRME